MWVSTRVMASNCQPVGSSSPLYHMNLNLCEAVSGDRYVIRVCTSFREADMTSGRMEEGGGHPIATGCYALPQVEGGWASVAGGRTGVAEGKATARRRPAATSGCRDGGADRTPAPGAAPPSTEPAMRRGDAEAGPGPIPWPGLR